MKKNDLIEIKKLDDKTLKSKVKKMAEEIQGLTLDKNMGKLTNKKIIKNKRRDVAQMKTILRQKEILQKLEEMEGAKNAEVKS